MPYTMKIDEADVFGKGRFVNANDKTECVEFIRQTTGAPQTKLWRQGQKISTSKMTIPRGTAIATFDETGKYPTDTRGMHAAIYIEHNAQRIIVLDQWKDQGEVKTRPIYFSRPKTTKRSNNADTFYVIE